VHGAVRRPDQVAGGKIQSGCAPAGTRGIDARRERGGVYSFTDGLTMMLRHRLELRLRRTAFGRRLWRWR